MPVFVHEEDNKPEAEREERLLVLLPPPPPFLLRFGWQSNVAVSFDCWLCCGVLFCFLLLGRLGSCLLPSFKGSSVDLTIKKPRAASQPHEAIKMVTKFPCKNDGSSTFINTERGRKKHGKNGVLRRVSGTEGKKMKNALQNWLGYHNPFLRLPPHAQRERGENTIYYASRKSFTFLRGGSYT